MSVAVVDSNVLIDYKDTSGNGRHERAEGIVRGIDRGELPTARVTDAVLLETLNWLHERGYDELAVDLYSRLSKSAGFELVHTTPADVRRGVDLFETYGGLSFGDATITAYMRQTDIEYLFSFDDDFDAVESVTRLETPTDPFE